MPERQLPLQVGDLLRLLGDLFRLLGNLLRLFGVLLPEPLILSSQSLDLMRVAWLPHATFMADSRPLYKYEILDRERRDPDTQTRLTNCAAPELLPEF